MTRKGKILLIGSGIVVFLFIIAGLALVRYANVIVRAGIEKAVGKDFSIESIDLKWGSVRARNVVMKNKAGKDVIRVEELMVRAAFMNLFREKYIISSLRLEKPYMYVEVDNKGRLVDPAFPPDEKQHPKREAPKTPVTFEKIVVSQGSVDYLDRKTPRVPVLTKVRDIKMQMEHLTVPFTNESTRYSFQAHVPTGKSTASIKSEGTIKLASQDVESASHVRGLDITHFKPYYDKQAKSMHVKRGFMDLDVRAKIVSRKIHAPGHAVLKGLELETGSGFGDRFMGVPSSVVLSSMKKSGELPVDFVVSGDLNNPKFNITENFMTKLSYGMAEKLGVSVTDIGGSIFGVGTEGTKRVGEGIGEGLKKILK
ncbi:MAG: hypothetical protein H6Q52_35 [Deltaproteobacteria bacterium]|nr:hypothetical protein [Deltaproteobacteria bacterium]